MTYKLLRVIGLMALLSYMIIILSTWMFANYNGSPTFRAGEPILIIKYIEWILGLVGIMTIPYYIRLEANS